MPALTVSNGKYWIDASTVGANWETTGFDDSAWTANPSPGSGKVVDLYDYSGLGTGANVGSVGGSDSAAGTVFVRFWIPAAKALRLIGAVDDWIDDLFINGSLVYSETSQNSHVFDQSFTEADGLERATTNLIAVKTVNRNAANQWSFYVEDTSTYARGATWSVGYAAGVP